MSLCAQYIKDNDVGWHCVCAVRLKSKQKLFAQQNRVLSVRLFGENKVGAGCKRSFVHRIKEFEK